MSGEKQVSARNARRIPCPICGESFDVRGHHHHVEKCRRLANAKEERAAPSRRGGRRGE
jgi:hypothetical protein